MRWTFTSKSVSIPPLPADGMMVGVVTPIRQTKHLTGDEVHALWRYLQTVPSVPTGGMQTASR